MSLFSLLAVSLLGPVLVALAPLAISRLARPRSIGAEIFAWRVILVSIIALPLAYLTLPSFDTGDAFPYVTPESLGVMLDNDRTFTSDLAIGVYVVGLIAIWVIVIAVRLRGLARMVAARKALSRHSESLELRMTTSGPVVIVTSHLVASPATLGTWLPRVFLPAEAPGWPERRRAAAIAHELAHVEQRDDLWSLFATMVVAVGWFHPLAWIARARHAALIELAADARAAASFGDAAEYAEELLAIRRDSMPRASLAPGMTGTSLGRRVDALLGPRPDLEVGVAMRVAMLAFALTVGAAVSLSGTTRAPAGSRLSPAVVSISHEASRRTSLLTQHRIRDSVREHVRSLGRAQREH